MNAPRPEQPFYLNMLLWCHQPMQPVTFRPDRTYQCGSCKRAVDALTAEVDVWDIVIKTRPTLGTAHTPYRMRAAILFEAVASVQLTGDGYLIQWRPNLGPQRPAVNTAPVPNQGRWDRWH